MNNQNNNSKIMYPVFVVIVAVIFYFLYITFFTSSAETSDNGNNILKNTKLGTVAEIINKENISFNSNAVNYFTNTKDFSIKVSPSNSNGRDNPFLP